MKFCSALILLAACSATSFSITDAFQVPSPIPSQKSRSKSELFLFGKSQQGGTNVKTAANWAANLAVAGTIFASSVATSTVAPLPANADFVELSTGAVIIQTPTKSGQSVLKAEVDAKNLFGTIFKNRKELKESLGRISDTVKAEFATPVWTELSKEFLQIEGDVAPEIKISPPRDIQQTIKDLSKGKLNFIVNGEVINVALEDSFSNSADEVVLRIKGVKGVPALATEQAAASAQVKTRLQEQIEFIDKFWETPVTLPKGIEETLPSDTVITYGNLVLSGTTAFVGGSYAIAYTYYISQQQAAEEEAEKRRKMIEERKQKSAEISSKKEGQQDESEEDS